MDTLGTRLLKMECPGCGYSLELDIDNLTSFCPSCGSKLLLDVNDIHKILELKEQTKQVQSSNDAYVETERIKADADIKTTQIVNDADVKKSTIVNSSDVAKTQINANSEKTKIESDERITLERLKNEREIRLAEINTIGADQVNSQTTIETARITADVQKTAIGADIQKCNVDAEVQKEAISADVKKAQFSATTSQIASNNEVEKIRAYGAADVRKIQLETDKDIRLAELAQQGKYDDYENREKAAHRRSKRILFWIVTGILLFLGLMALCFLPDVGKKTIPCACEEMVGMDYSTLESLFTKAGFSNVNVVGKSNVDGEFNEGETISVSIGGKLLTDGGYHSSTYDSDEPVLITYFES